MSNEVSDVVGKLVEEPWNADEIIPALSAEQRAEVRAAVLALAGEEPTSSVVAVLGHFPEGAVDEVIDALEAILADDDLDSDVHDAVPEALARLNTPRARARLVELVDDERDDVARTAIEHLEDTPEHLAALLLPRLDELAGRGDDLLTLAIVKHVAPLAIERADVAEALARHWDFALRHRTTLMASNAIFDALVAHAPASPAAQRAFAAAAAHADEYAQIRGRGALALTGEREALGDHLAALAAIKATKPSSRSLREVALKRLVAERRADLEALAAAGHKAAVKALK